MHVKYLYLAFAMKQNTFPTFPNSITKSTIKNYFSYITKAAIDRPICRYIETGKLMLWSKGSTYYHLRQMMFFLKQEI